MGARLISRCLLLAGVLGLAAGCGGSEAADSNEAVLIRLQSAYPGAPIQAVKPSPIKGVYEVSLGGKMMYADATGRYVLFGSLHDMRDERLAEPSQVGSSNEEADKPQEIGNVQEAVKVAERDAIKYVRGNGATRLYLFSDPKCPFCRQLEGELDKFENVTIYKFPYPVLSDESRAIASKVWCSSDRAADWTRAINGLPVAGAGRCNTPLDSNIRLARSLGVRGTPTLFNAKGQMIVGYQPAAGIASALAVPGFRK